MIDNLNPCSQEAHGLEETNIEVNSYSTIHTLAFFLKRAHAGYLQEKVETKKAKRVFLGILPQTMILLAET